MKFSKAEHTPNKEWRPRFGEGFTWCDEPFICVEVDETYVDVGDDWIMFGISCEGRLVGFTEEELDDSLLPVNFKVEV
jgi:hypothetical protein